MLRPRFVGSFPRADLPLDPPHPEIAFLGRSNVGKSSLLNALVGRRVARVSGTPGKTRMLNVYEMTLPRADRLPACYLLDLPGYGYARAGKADRAAFRRLVRGTLDRPGLQGVVWLLDIRHDPSADDRAMQDLLARQGTRVLAALTKSDKLPRGQRLRREQALIEALGLDPDQAVATSARTGEGIAELREAIGAFLEGGRAVQR
ncbi:MAG TPA: ribosome biogenesis GTP-binding protein YihA/YsxC [Gemmatimonadales bacterium]|nr:ribosome biogenesis GTP-binding protein YihA/YsxC [Gemmatimonadales bacterium]